MLSIANIGASPLDPYYTSLVGRPDNGARNTVTAAGLETPLLASNATPTTSVPALYPATPPIGETATTPQAELAPPLLPPTRDQQSAGFGNPLAQGGLTTLADTLIANLRGADSASRAGTFVPPPGTEETNASRPQAANDPSGTSTTTTAASSTPPDPADANGDGKVSPVERFDYAQKSSTADGADAGASPFGAQILN